MACLVGNLLTTEQTTVGETVSRISPFQLRIYRCENYKVGGSGGGDWI